jgi:hypothetical protein
LKILLVFVGGRRPLIKGSLVFLRVARFVSSLRVTTAGKASILFSC